RMLPARMLALGGIVPVPSEVLPRMMAASWSRVRYGCRSKRAAMREAVMSFSRQVSQSPREVISLTSRAIPIFAHCGFERCEHASPDLAMSYPSHPLQFALGYSSTASPDQVM